MNYTGKGYFHNKLDDEQIQNAIIDYKNGLTLKALSEKLLCCTRTIKSELIKNNAYKIIKQPKHTLNTEFFKNIDSEESAYWLGMLAADGCIRHDKKGYNVSLTLKSSDKEHVNKFKNALNATHPVYDHNSIAKGKLHKQNSISIWSKPLVVDLINHGLSPRKSLTLTFPVLKSNLVRHYIRGYFDGDGSWYLQKGKYPAFSLIGTTEFIYEVQKILVKACSLPFNKITTTKTPGLVKLHYTGGKQCIKLFHYLYDDATVWMSRKFKKISLAL